MPVTHARRCTKRLQRYQNPFSRRRPAGLEQAGQVQLVDGVAGEAQHGGQQRQGGDEHHEDGGDARRGQADHVRLADEVEAEERDHHGAAGEEDRAARRHEGRHDRVAGITALEDALPVAGDDEEGVVDADPDADHGGHLRARSSGR